SVLLKPPSLSLSARLSADRSLPQTGQRFQFSQVYGPETTQRELFEGTVKDLVKDVLEGRNSLVFTYGVTNAGKTFTFLGPDADAGVLPRTLNVIFNSVDEQVFPEMSIKPHRCREFTRLTREQQAEEALFKRNLFRQLKEVTGPTSMLSHSTANSVNPSEDKLSLEVEPHTKFSIWVSFCEIYNENIHDLLEAVPSGAPRRTVLRLSQDVKGNAFVKDLRWVQVSSAEEAYRVMKLGKKNQSFSSTRLNHLSSRSHSIFSIRILRIEDIGTPRVQTVSELCLCDLAGSERCAKTQNKGERLKEAGNINTSLLILGKCINALRHNQQAKLLQHVPFRESKLTHYLQGFFCGRGKACMIVNINQCASMYDETLNVLKFSAVAQKVHMLLFLCFTKQAKTNCVELENELSQIKQQLAQKQLISDQQLEELTEKLHQKEAASKQQVEELRKKLEEQEETSQQPLEELRSQHQGQQQAAKAEIEQLKAKLEQQAEASEKQVEQLNEKLREQQVVSLQQLEELKNKLSEEKTASDKLLDDLKQQLSEQQRTAELLKTELEEAQLKATTGSSSSENEDLKRLNSDLLTEVAALKAKVSNMEETKESSSKAEAQLKEQDTQTEEKLSELQKASAQKEAELQKKLLEKEAEVTSLKKNLQEAEDRREEEECQAVQEARRREVERRRELLAVAHESPVSVALIRPLSSHVALEQRAVFCVLNKALLCSPRLKEDAKQDSEKVKSLSLDLQRKEDDSSDLREKLADYKKQIQQVQKEVQALFSVCSSHLIGIIIYSCFEQNIEQILRVMEDMRLALTEQEETQEQMEQVLEEKLNLIQELSSDKHQAERRKWLEEKLSLIGQAKEAEDKRNQEMRKFAEDRERYTRQHGHEPDTLTCSQHKITPLDLKWRKERDALVAALEVQLQKLLSSQAEKDKLIQQLRQNDTQTPQEVSAASGRYQTREPLTEDGSAGYPSVLDSSEISTENGRTSRFPRPELEISFSPLQPNRVALRRQGEESAVTVKLTRSARKRKSSEMEKVGNNKQLLNTGPTRVNTIMGRSVSVGLHHHKVEDIYSGKRTVLASAQARKR
uniref:Kinesin family member 20B n=1 Tax=Stegastes partitus TaxID=144197 RepID=A0A3B5B9W5_9TELE